MKFLFSFAATTSLWISHATAVSSYTREQLEFTSIDRIEETYFKSVLDTCSVDVQQFCAPVTESIEGQRRMEQEPSNDLLQSSIIHTLGHHRALIDEFDTFVDSFVRPNSQWVIVFDNEQLSNERRPCPKLAAEAAAMRHGHDLVRNMALNFHPSTFDFVSERLQTHGNDLLSREDELGLTAPGRRMARRLKEVTAEELHDARKSFLPFSERQADCLERVYVENSATLSSRCILSLDGLHAHRSYLKNKSDSEDELAMVQIAFFIGVYALMMISICVRVRRNGDRAKREQKLQELILSTVYSNPELKRLVEMASGESLGFEPPFPAQVRAQRELRRNKKSGKVSFTIVLMFLSYLWLVVFGVRSMGAVYFYAVLFALYAGFVLHATFIKKVEEPICTCCCCAMTSKMASEGLGSPEQQCCDCCKGTGVCSPECASCCGPDSDKNGSDKHCCDMDKELLLPSKNCCNGKSCCAKDIKGDGQILVV